MGVDSTDAYGKPLFNDVFALPSDLQAAADYTDEFANVRRGNSTDRQSLPAGKRRDGMLWVESDTGSVYGWRDATGWMPVVVADTGWKTLTLTTGWSVYLGETPKWRVKSGILFMSGRIQAAAGVGQTFATLPAEARHTTSLLVFKTHQDNGIAGVTVGNNGECAVFEPATSVSRNGISLAPISYPVG